MSNTIAHFLLYILSKQGVSGSPPLSNTPPTTVVQPGTNPNRLGRAGLAAAVQLQARLPRPNPQIRSIIFLHPTFLSPSCPVHLPLIPGQKKPDRLCAT
jgi:hypothetical protein